VTTNQFIQDFLGRKRFAMVGVSRNQNDFSRKLFEAFCECGYDVAPVNPASTQIGNQRCHARVQDVPDVKSALLMTPPKSTESVVRDCAEAGIELVWMYRAVGSGAVSHPALDFCAARGIRVIEGYCPFMFLPDTGFPHNLHRFFLKLTGHYPA
jgi:uncharacterized protein